MVSLLLVSVLFWGPLILMGSISGWGAIKMASANEPTKDVILVHTVQLKPMIKAQISGRMVSIGISDVAIASVHSEKTRLKKCMMIMIIIMLMNKLQKNTAFAGTRILLAR